MQFANPLMLMTLGLIPVLILIHALKPKPREVVVTNLFLWQEAVKERTSHLTVTKLKKNLPLLLQILMVCLAALALANPLWLSFSRPTGHMILVIDTSASMQTRVESSGVRTRFDQAVDKALALIDDRKRSQNILIVAAGKKPVVPAGLSEDAGEAGKILKSLNATDVRGDLKRAVRTAISFMSTHQTDRIYLITDGAGCNFSEIVALHPRIIPVVISGGGRNIGITRFEFRKRIDRHDRYEVLLEVKNYSEATETIPVRLFIDRTRVFDTTLDLKGSEKKLLILPYAGIISGMAKLFLDMDDDFLVDNRAFLSLSSTRDIWVLLVSKGNYFLEKMLASYPNVMVNTIREIDPSFWKEQVYRHDLVIVDRLDFPPIQRGNFLLIDSYSPSLPVKKEGVIEFPDVVAWDAEHPVLDNVDLGGLFIEASSKITATPGALPIMESSETGLIFALEADGLRAVVVGFDITRSDLPVKIAYPVLMSNIINWLNPHKLSFSSMHTRSGDPYALHLQPQTRSLSIRGPRQDWEVLEVDSNPFIYPNTQKVGIYTYIENNKRHHFTVNLLDELESDIRIPAMDYLPEIETVDTEPEDIPVGRPLWAAFLLSALAILLVEWIVWLKIG